MPAVRGGWSGSEVKLGRLLNRKMLIPLPLQLGQLLLKSCDLAASFLGLLEDALELGEGFRRCSDPAFRGLALMKTRVTILPHRAEPAGDDVLLQQTLKLRFDTVGLGDAQRPHLRTLSKLEKHVVHCEVGL